MGMFDEIRLGYKIPFEEVQADFFQTKDTPAQALDLYEIREDGTLWYEAYDSRWEEDADSLLGGFVRRYNKRWEHVGDFTGELEVHHGTGDPPFDKWYSISFWIKRGVVSDMVINSPAEGTEGADAPAVKDVPKETSGAPSGDNVRDG